MAYNYIGYSFIRIEFTSNFAEVSLSKYKKQLNSVWAANQLDYDTQKQMTNLLFLKTYFVHNLKPISDLRPNSRINPGVRIVYRVAHKKVLFSF